MQLCPVDKKVEEKLLERKLPVFREGICVDFQGCPVEVSRAGAENKRR